MDDRLDSLKHSYDSGLLSMPIPQLLGPPPSNNVAVAYQRGFWGRTGALSLPPSPGEQARRVAELCVVRRLAKFLQDPPDTPRSMAWIRSFPTFWMSLAVRAS
jgi:hypothetical protein